MRITDRHVIDLFFLMRCDAFAFAEIMRLCFDGDELRLAAFVEFLDNNGLKIGRRENGNGRSIGHFFGDRVDERAAAGYASGPVS